MDSDDEDILYDNDLGRNLIGGKRVKNVNDVLNGGKKDKRKLRKTLALCMAFLCLGLCLAILGPTLLSLKEHLSTTLPKISWVFAGRSVGYLTGAILGGMLFESYNPIFLLAVSLLLCGIGIVIAPFVTTVLVLAMSISTVGVSMGFLDTGANLVCLRMWGKKRSGTMLQALHFSFALGAFISPLVAAPFLAATPANTTLATSTTPTMPLNTSAIINIINATSETALPKTTTKEPLPTTTTKEPLPTTTTKEPLPTNTTKEPLPTTTTIELLPTATTTEPLTTTATQEILTQETLTTIILTKIIEVDKEMDGTARRRKRDDKKSIKDESPKLPTDPAIKTSPTDSATPTTSPTDPANPTTSPTDPAAPTPSLQSAPQRQVERFAIAYIIIGVMVLLTSVVFFFFLCTQPKGEPHYTGSEHHDEKSAKTNSPFRTRIIILLFFFYFLYVGGEVAYGSFVSMFASKSKYQFEQDRASHVAALFWGAFALGRGLAICLASVISPLKMVVGDMVGCVSTSLVLTLFADSNENVLWIGSAVLGLSMASLFPSGIAWLQSYTPVTGNTASFLIVGSALGEMCVPLVIGYLFEDIVGPMVLMYWMLATSAVSALIFVYVIWLVRENGQEKKSLPAEKSPALELFQSVEEALPMEELFKNGSSNKQMSKQRIPPILKRKNHKE